MYKVISFYTVHTPYEQEIKILEQSLKDVGIRNYVFYPVASRGAWVRNCAIKPEIIQKALHAFVDDIVYLDADAVVDAYPILFDTFDADLGVHYYKKRELLSGTLYFRRCSVIHDLIADWVCEQQKQPDVWDQKILQQILPNHTKVKIGHLPEEYVKIINVTRNQKGNVPIIRHNQASRRFRSLINSMGYSDIKLPDGVRSAPDGTFWIPRRNKELEKYMDINFSRLGTSELRWKLKAAGNRIFKDLEPIFKGKTVYILGKGPSLDHLTADYFIEPDSPIVCINESVHVLNLLDVPNPVYVMQQDARLKDKCKPKEGAMILGATVANFYADYPHKYVYTLADFPYPGGGLTADMAIKICHFLNVAKIKMVSFDAATHQDTGYATKMDADIALGGSPQRFLSHINSITRCLAKMPVEWITPKDQNNRHEEEASDTLLLSQDNLEERHETSPDEP